MIYIVIGAARTGSMWLCSLLADNSDLIWSRSDQREEVYSAIQSGIDHKKDILIHSHDKELVNTLGLSYADVTLIISKRRDLFECVMSTIISQKTEEFAFGAYTYRQPEPFSYDPNDFLRICAYKRNWYNDIDLSKPYYKIVTVYHEDMIVQHLKYITVLGLNKESIKINNKSPYHYTDWVSNWAELYQLYYENYLDNHLVEVKRSAL